MTAKLEIVPLPLLKKTEEGLVQCLEIQIELSVLSPECNAVLKVIRGLITKEYNLGKFDAMQCRREIYFPEAEAAVETVFVLSYADAEVTQKLLVGPVRRWTIFLVLHSHTDLGFTVPVSEVAKIHNDNTDIATLYCKETEHWPEGSRFKWTCEVSWQLQNYIRDREQNKVADLMQQVRKKNIEVAGLYSGELTELLGHEEAARSFYYAAKLRREYDINIDTAMLCDVPGCTKGFVQIMAKSGIKNFILADNNFIAPFLKRTDLPRPFYWKGDDNTRILSWYTDHPFYAYIEGQNYGLAYSYSETRDKLPYKLLELENNGYTLNEFQLQYAFDNFRIEFRPAAIVKEWNETWEYPKIRISTAGEFLNTIREKYSDQIPVIQGDWTNWWDGIVTGFPYEASLSRLLHSAIPALETALTTLKITAGSTYPAEKINQMYENILAFDEHSGTGMVWEAKSEEQQQKALKEGYGFIQKPFEESLQLQDMIKNELLKIVKIDTESVLVFNPGSLKSSGKVSLKVDLPDGSLILGDKTNCKKIPASIEQGNLTFFAEDIPQIGYKTFQILNEHPGDVLIRPGIKLEGTDRSCILENEHYKVQVDKQSGRIISLFNKNLNKEISGIGLNIPVIYQPKPLVQVEMGKYIPEIYNGDEVPGEELEFSFGDTKINILVNEAEFAECIIDKQFNKTKWLSQRITLNEDTITFENIIDRHFIYNKDLLQEFLTTQGMLYFLFSFNIPHARFRYEAPCAVLNPEAEQFKGSCKDYYAVQRWCQLFNDEFVINFSTLDSPLIDVGEIALHKYRNNFPADPSRFYIRALSFNDISNVLRSPYNPWPDLHFRVSISINKASEKYVEDEPLPSLLPAYRLGNSLHNNLLAFHLQPGTGGILSGDKFSFFEVSPVNFELLTIKKAEDNEDIILRLREILGLKSIAVVSSNSGKIKKVFRTLITEEIIEELPYTGKSFKLSAKPFSVETIRIRFKSDVS